MIYEKERKEYSMVKIKEESIVWGGGGSVGGRVKGVKRKLKLFHIVLLTLMEFCCWVWSGKGAGGGGGGGGGVPTFTITTRELL
jgi:hypothetical protein